MLFAVYVHVFVSNSLGWGYVSPKNLQNWITADNKKAQLTQREARDSLGI